MSRPIIPKTWDVPLEFKRRIGSHVGRQRLFSHDDQLLLVLHKVPHATDNGKREPALFWKNADNEWKSLCNGGGLHALTRHIESYESAMEELDTRLDEANEASDYFSVLREVKPLLRATRNMVSVLEELRSLMPDDYAVMSLRDRGISLIRSIEFIESDARHGMDFCMAESAAKQAEATREAIEESRQLNRMVAFFFPLATLAAILGMNPPAEVLGSFHIWLIILLGVISGWYLRRNKINNVFTSAYKKNLEKTKSKTKSKLRDKKNSPPPFKAKRKIESFSQPTKAKISSRSDRTTPPPLPKKNTIRPAKDWKS